MTTSSVIERYPQPLSPRDAEAAVTSLIWAGQLDDACKLAKQMRDSFALSKLPELDFNTREWHRARERYDERSAYWLGAWGVLLNITGVAEAKRERIARKRAGRLPRNPKPKRNHTP